MFTNFGFHYPLTVALLQMAFIAPVSYVVARPILSMSLVKQLAPLAMVNVMNVVCGLIGGWDGGRQQQGRGDRALDICGLRG